LNRPIQVVTPASSGMRPSVLRPSYDEGGRLARVDVWLRQATAPTTLLASTTADLHAVAGLAYNARGQRTALALGNGPVPTYDSDRETFRLPRRVTTRPAAFGADQRTVQDLAYPYDPVGNIPRLRDTADTQNVIFFQDRRVEPTADYTYDPLYRLVSATG